MPDSFDPEDFLKRFQRGKYRQELATGPVSDIAGHVRALFASRSLTVHLWINSPGGRISACFHKMLHRGIKASIQVMQDSDEARAAFDFLANRGLELPEDTPLPETFLPGLPVYLIPRISPLPSDPLHAAQLVSSLFQHVGVPEDSVLSYIFHEVTDSTSRF